MSLLGESSRKGKWEYLFFVIDFDIVIEIDGVIVSNQKIPVYKKVAELGLDGWELASSVHYAGARNIMLIFKRPLNAG